MCFSRRRPPTNLAGITFILDMLFRKLLQGMLSKVHQKDIACSTDNRSTLTLEADTITDSFDVSVNKATQTDDSDLFITCYDHSQAQ